MNFLFIFPMMAGVFNPSLPIARYLVDNNHTVHYLSFNQLRDPVEDVGAIFYSAVEWEHELYQNRTPDFFSAIDGLRSEYGLVSDGEYLARCKLVNVQIVLQLPGLLRFVDEYQPDMIIYDPIVSMEGAFVAKVANLPAVSLLIFAGPAG